jgi:outer membrane protein assembly factor BamB
MSYRALPESPILVVAFNGRVFGLNAKTGERVWSYEGMQSEMAVVRAIVDNMRVYASSGTKLSCLDYASGRCLWQVEIGMQSSTLMTSAGRIFVGGQGKLRCFADDGSLLWEEGFKGKGLGVIALALPGHAVQGDA